MITVWMTYSLIVSLAFAVSASVLDRATSGALHQRRWIWVFALALSAGMPAWQLAAPRLGFVQATLAPQLVGAVPAKTASPSMWAASQSGLAELIARADSGPLGTVSVAVAWTWLAAVLVAVIGYAATAWSLTRRRRAWRKVVIDGQPVWLAAATGPAVIGAVRPSIVVPEWWRPLEHERQHVRARDPLLLQAAALVGVLVLVKARSAQQPSIPSRVAALQPNDIAPSTSRNTRQGRSRRARSAS